MANIRVLSSGKWQVQFRHRGLRADQSLFERRRGLLHRLGRHRPSDELVEQLRRDLGQYRRLHGRIGFLLSTHGWAPDDALQLCFCTRLKNTESREYKS